MPRNYYDVSYDSGPSWGEQFGQGLLSGLEGLVEHKIGQIQHRHQMKQTQQAYEGFGAPSNIARALSMSTPEVQKLYLQSGAPAYWQQQQMQAQQLSPIKRNMQQLQQPQQLPIESQALRQRLGNALNPTGDERQEELLNKLRSPAQQREALRERGLPLPQEQPRQQMQAQPQPIILPESEEPIQQPRQALSVEENLERQLPQQPAFVPFAKNQPLNISGVTPQQQRTINSTNAPYLKTLDKAVTLADNMETIGEQMQALLNTGNVYSGVKGRFAPTQLQNDETQQFEALSNELASLLASQSGVATNFKIKLAQSMKPNISQNQGTQRRLVKDILDKSRKLKEFGEVRDELIAENGGEQPANIQSKINQRIKSGSKKQSAELPGAQEYEEGSIIETDGNFYQNVGNQWIEVNYGR